MISLQRHDRVGRSAPSPLSALPGIDERAAIARAWAAATPPPAGMRRDQRRTTSARVLPSQLASQVSAVVDPVVEAHGDCDVAGLRAFAERMLRRD